MKNLFLPIQDMTVFQDCGKYYLTDYINFSQYWDREDSIRGLISKSIEINPGPAVIKAMNENKYFLKTTLIFG